MNAPTTMTQERFESSVSIGKLALALSKAQGAMTSAKKDSVGVAMDQSGGRKYPYATLASTWDAVRGPLSANELAVIQTTERAGPDGVCVVTTLAHSSDEWVRSRLYMPVKKADAQGFGSALTYARRYALSAIVGIAPEDDDASDAVHANDRDTKPANVPQRDARPAKPAQPKPSPTSPATPPGPVAAPAVQPDTKPANVMSTQHEGSQAEELLIERLTPLFTGAKDEAAYKAACKAAMEASAGPATSPRYRKWYSEMKAQARAALGIPERGAGPGPAKANGAAPQPVVNTGRNERAVVQ